jgi:hypothetical protein
METKMPSARPKQSRGQGKLGGYSVEKLRADLEAVSKVYEEVQARRERDAIYEYWIAVYRLRRRWRRLKNNEGVDIKKIAKEIAPGWVSQPGADDALRFIIHQTMATSAKSPAARTKFNKLRSKYLYLLNFAYKRNIETSRLEKFIRDHGGLNFKP